MKFHLFKASCFNTDEERERYAKLGFAFKAATDLEGKPWYDDTEKPPEVEINTLEELLNFADEWGDIIVHQREDGTFKVTIYDDYLE